MSQLTVTAYYTRKTIKLTVIFLMSFFILKSGFQVFKYYWRKFNPPPPPPPDTAFGKLPAINFPHEKGKKPESFQLETINGSLPTDLPGATKVYFIPQIEGKFLSLDKTISLARAIGFQNPPEKISENIYRFRNSVKNINLKINVLTKNFEYSYSYLDDQTLINPPSLPSKEEATKTAKSFLRNMGKLTDELEEGEAEGSYWKIKEDHLIRAVAPAEADFIRIDIFRKKINDQYSIVSPWADKSLVSVLISGINIQSENVVEVKYTHFPVDLEKYATYPLKEINQAWEELKSGNFFLASSGDNQEMKSVKVRKVSLGYFNPSTPTKFLQPIFIFQGDNNFWGYVPAILTEWSE